MSKAILRFLALSCALSLPAAAAGLDDPFDTEALTPLRPSPRLAARVGEAPCATALPARPLTAIDAVDLALCNNPQTREIWAAARVQAALFGLAQSAWLPNLDGRAGLSRNFSDNGNYTQRNAALTLSWLLLDFGQRAASTENARQLLAAAAATQGAAVQSLFLSALQAYYNAQAAHAAVASAIEAERSARESFNAADARYTVGAGTPADSLQARTALSQATLTRIRAEGEAANALGVLANLMGFSAREPLVLAEFQALSPDEDQQRDVAALIDLARARRPDLRAAEAQLKAAEANIDLARAQGRPTLSLSAGPSWQEIGGASNHGGSIGLSLNIPFFSGFETTYRVRSAQAQAELRAAQRDSLNNQIALDVWRAYQNLNTAAHSLRTTADLVASAEQSERVALGRYKAGVGTVLELLSAQSALAHARLQRIQAALDWQVFRATLAQAMGALDDTLLQAAPEDRP